MSANPHLRIVQITNEVKGILRSVGAILASSSDLGINFALIETETSLQEAITSLSTAERLCRPK